MIAIASNDGAIVSHGQLKQILRESLDLDNDGRTDFQEWGDGTDPTEAETDGGGSGAAAAMAG